MNQQLVTAASESFTKRIRRCASTESTCHMGTRVRHESSKWAKAPEARLHKLLTWPEPAGSGFWSLKWRSWSPESRADPQNRSLESGAFQKFTGSTILIGVLNDKGEDCGTISVGGGCWRNLRRILIQVAYTCLPCAGRILYTVNNGSDQFNMSQLTL